MVRVPDNHLSWYSPIIKNTIYSSLQQLQRQVEFLSDKAECANADLKADMDRWHKHKRKDVKQVLVDIAEHQTKKYEDVSTKRVSNSAGSGWGLQAERCKTSTVDIAEHRTKKYEDMSRGCQTQQGVGGVQEERCEISTTGYR